jgi:hypothetical protein
MPLLFRKRKRTYLNKTLSSLSFFSDPLLRRAVVMLERNNNNNNKNKNNSTTTTTKNDANALSPKTSEREI